MIPKEKTYRKLEIDIDRVVDEPTGGVIKKAVDSEFKVFLIVAIIAGLMLVSGVILICIGVEFPYSEIEVATSFFSFNHIWVLPGVVLIVLGAVILLAGIINYNIKIKTRR